MKPTFETKMSVSSEFLGCLMYNFIATGVLSSTAVLTFGELLAPRLVVLSLGAGFGYLTGLFTSTSGGYLNPAVTASLMALYPLNKGNMSPLKGLMNMLAQLIGTAVGIALVVRFLLFARSNVANSHETHRSQSFPMRTKVTRIWAFRHLRTERPLEADLRSKPWERFLSRGSF